MRVKSFDHVALWVDEREALARMLCEVFGMREIDRTDAFTLVGGDAREGKLTLFDAEGSRPRGLIDRIVLRVPDLDGCVARARAHGLAMHANGVVMLEAPANVPLGVVQREACALVDLDHIVLRVPDLETTGSALARLGFERRGSQLVVDDRHILLEAGDLPDPAEPPLLNHLALLVASLDETLDTAGSLGVAIDRVVDAPNTLAAFVIGPDGIVVEYVEHKPGFSLT